MAGKVTFVQLPGKPPVVPAGGPSGTEWASAQTTLGEVRPWLKLMTAANYIGAGTHGFGTCDPANETPLSNAIYMYPLYFADPVTITEIGFSVQTAGAAGTLARLGLFAPQTVSGTVMNLILDAGTVLTDTTGSKIKTISQAVQGWVWPAVVCNGSPTLRFTASPYGYDGIAVGGTPNSARVKTGHGAGPAAFGATETMNITFSRFPYIWLRRS